MIWGYHHFRKHPYLQDDPGISDPNLPKSEADWMPSEDDAAQAPVGGVAWMVQRLKTLGEVFCFFI